MPPPGRNLKTIEIFGAVAIGVLTGVYIFGPAAKESGEALSGKSEIKPRGDTRVAAEPPPRTSSWKN